MSKFIKLSTLTVIASCPLNSYAKSAIEEIGGYMQVIVPAYAFGMAVNEKDWEGTKQFTYSFATMEIGVNGLKSIIKEERPDGSNNKSFPSGHTASAFSGATFIHKRYGVKRAIIPYAMATFTGYSRIESDKHHWWDVAAGAAISSLTTWFFVSEYNDVRVSVSTDKIKLGFRMEF
ncbi:MAG: phosphatase PAP2 family protein [Rickettsiales bacterium]|jgi:membrane-associated phospholipid phosphatase|nr:phosphatase PAP2 family protein [Rickettsiales bacterium]